jgi:hypothetical protein
MTLSMLDPSLKSTPAPAFADAEMHWVETDHAFETRRFRRHGLRPLVADCLLLAEVTSGSEHEGAPVQIVKLYEAVDGVLILEVVLGRPDLANAFHDCQSSGDADALLAWLENIDVAAIMPCELLLDSATRVGELQAFARNLKTTLEAARAQLQQLLSHYIPHDRHLAA